MRKKRSDAGVIQITDRDIELLTWIGEQFAVRYDQVGEVLRRYAVEHRGKAIGEEAIKKAVGRWVRGDFVIRKKIKATEPAWVYLSKKGIETVGLTFPFREPSVSQLNHYFHINKVRLALEALYAKDPTARWVSENSIISRWVAEGDYSYNSTATVKRHRPDGEFSYTEEGVFKTVAIEVELTQKSRKRLDKIIAELLREYEYFWYFVNEDTLRAIREILSDASFAHIEKRRRDVFLLSKL